MIFKNRHLPPLIPLCGLLCLGILTGSHLKANAVVWYCFLIPVGLYFLYKLFKREASGWLKGGFFFLLGAMLICRVESPSMESSRVLTYSNQGKVWVVGRVVTLFPENETKKSLVMAVIEAGKTRSEVLPTTGRIKVTLRDTDWVPAYGDIITVRGIVRPFRNFANPGGFDYVRFMKRKGIMASLYCRGPDFSLEVARMSPSWITAWVRGIARIRNTFSLYIQSTVKDQNSAALLNALVLGNRGMLSTDLQNTFSRSGASHILAVSGLHLSIVATLFFFLFQKFFSLFTPLLIRGLARKGAALMTLLPLAGYALISGFSPATQRALIMVSVLMLSLVMERENVTLNALAAAGIGILMLQPAALFSISFQLSFTAVFFIISGLDLARRRGFPAFGHFLLNRGTVFVLVSLLAIAGTQPLVMRYFNMASPAGVFTNIITIPGVGFGVLPLGLLAFLLFTFFPTASGLCLFLAGGVAGPCISFLTWVCHLPGAWIRTVTPDLFYLVAWYLALGAFYVWVRSEIRKLALFLGAMALLIFFINGAVDLRHRYFTKTLDITVLDVGQGNSALIRLPGGVCFLVDGGGFSSNSVFDTGRYLVAPFLWQQHILTLEGVVLTHPDADHMNGLLYILENFRVKALYKNADQAPTQSYRQLMALARSGETAIHRVAPHGEVVAVAPEIIFRFMPGFQGDGGQGKASEKSFNDNALVLAVRFRQFSMLFPADIMARREAGLVASQGENLKSTLLLVPHHGSSSSSTSGFLDLVKPEAALISCGWHNRFKFPHSRVVKRYQKRNITLYRTDLDGAIRVVSDGTTWHLLPTRQRELSVF